MNGNKNKNVGNVVPITHRLKKANGLTEPFDPFGFWNLVPDEEALKRGTIRNILDSYQSIYDLPIEMHQNAVDEIERRLKLSWQLWGDDDPDFRPQLWTIINLRDNELTVIDNGSGLCKGDLLRVLIPNLSLKRDVASEIGCGLRGHLGVGLTFAAYCSNYIRISTAGEDGYLSFELSGALSWAMGIRGSKQPAARPSKEVCEIFNKLKSGTAVTVRLGEDTRPAALYRLGTTMRRWEMNLRTRTAIGFVDLAGREKWNNQVAVNLILIDAYGSLKSGQIPFAYPFPHAFSNFNFMDFKKYSEELKEKASAAPKHKNKDALYRTWTRRELFHPKRGIVSEDRCPHLSSRLVAVYGFFAHSAGIFSVLNELAGGDKRTKVIKPGVWVVAHNAVVGRPIPLDLGYGAGNADRLFMLVEVDDISPDLGRKGFDPELEREIKHLGGEVIKYFVDKRRYLKPAGLQASQSADRMAQHQRIREAEKRAEESPLSGGYSLRSEPRNEPEVIGLFFELLGRGDIVGYRLFGAYHSATYDGVFGFHLGNNHPKAIYNQQENPLGLSPAVFAKQKTVEHPPAMIEFKVSMDNLVEELSSNQSPKRFESLALVVVWEIGCKWEGSFDLLDLTQGGAVTSRELFAATHLLLRKGVSEGHSVHVIELKKALELLG